MQTILVEREIGSIKQGVDYGSNEYSRGYEATARREAVFTPKTTFAPPAAENGARNSRSLVDAMVNSKIYQDYEKAFTEATGLKVTFRPVESWQFPHNGKHTENPFFRAASQDGQASGICLQVQQALHGAQTVASPATCNTAVPVRLGDRLIGFLQTAQVFRNQQGTSDFDHVTTLRDDWGVEGISNKQQEGVMKLLGIFAQHLSMLSNQVVVRQEHSEPPAITKAREYINEHQTEDLSLGQVAKAVNTSTFYFCKLFKKATGINFTDYLSRVRIERAKNLLLNPNLRVSEIAFEVGFQSLTHFNRVFKKILGQSPTEYRAQVAAN